MNPSPTTQAPPQPETLEDALNAAMASESYLVAVWRIEGGLVHLYRESQSFPEDDFPTAQHLLHRDLDAAVTDNTT